MAEEFHRIHRYSASKGIPGLAVAPGIGFGEHGDGPVRIALAENTQRLRQALRNIRGFLQNDNAAPELEEMKS
jgi:alanine-synthesizing transaminase